MTKNSRKTILLFILLVSSLGFSQSKIGIIKDKDGFVNIRSGKSSKSQIIGEILEKEYFTFFEDTISNWWIIESKSGLIGFMHKSRISFVKNGYLQQGKFLDKIVEISLKEPILGGVSINIFQLRPKEDYYDFSCKALIRTVKDNKIIDEVDYKEIEPVGSSYGITFSQKQISNLFIASKFGDYHGEVVVIDLNGKITMFEGGQYFITNDNKYLISSWSSDTSGLTIYDLKNKRVRFKQELDVYLGNWYFNKGVYYAPVWNGTEETDKTFQIDFNEFRLRASELRINIGEQVKLYNKNCNCK